MRQTNPGGGQMSDRDGKKESFLFRVHGLVRREHFSVLSGVWLICMVGILFYFGTQAYLNDGLIDIDNAPTRSFRYSVELNTAHWPEFANLPGIGEVLARSIVRYRDEHGAFQTLDELMTVPQIGEAKFEMLRPFLVLNDTQPNANPVDSPFLE